MAKVDEKQADVFVKEYETKREFYKEFAIQLKSVIQNILDAGGLKYFSVESRAKAGDSLRQKLLGLDRAVGKLEDIQDLAAVRVITYVYKDVEEIEKLIEKNFDIKEKEEVEDRLGTDKMGYRSHHRIINLSKERLILPEYKKFSGIVAELQICTILQHAWAQVEHDQIYKADSVLPKKIKRDFSLLAGLLELADNEFNRISGEISQYKKDIDIKTGKGELDIAIDSISLRQYYESRFKNKIIDARFGPADNMAEEIIREFAAMGINTLKDLDAIIPNDYAQQITKKKNGLRYTNYCGMSRDFMIIHDPDKYFSVAWGSKWVFGEDDNIELLVHYGVKPELLETHKIESPKLAE